MGLKITTLMENRPSDMSLYYEHGLSLFLEVGEKRILFDTGQSDAFLKNAQKLNVDLNELDYVIISHGHYDHSGGFKAFVREVGNAFKLIVGNAFFDEKYKHEDGKEKYIGNAFDKDFLLDNNISVEYIKDNMHYITDDIILFSNFSRKNDFEIPDDKLCIKQGEAFNQDGFKDEIVLGIRLDEGLCIITGCSHNGIVNILSSITERIGLPIKAVIGGTHLINADAHRIKKTLEYIKEIQVPILGPSHCTGEKAMEIFYQEYKDQFIDNYTGTIIQL